ncbi:MAG TPA: hypothetical protein VJT31_34465 [Rugosimonospora sp.]|nr:hypothetical protein [Rugosimonospora sp.]
MWRRILRRRSADGCDRRVRKLVGSLPLPVPFTIEGLVNAVAERTGRRIVLHPLYDLPPEISGVSLPKTGDENETSYVICYDATVPAWSQQLIILHELGHHLLGHSHHGDSRGSGVRLGLARTSFDDPLEVDAEWFATLMANRIERQQRVETSPTLRVIRRGIEPRHRWTDE